MSSHHDSTYDQKLQHSCIKAKSAMKLPGISILAAAGFVEVVSLVLGEDSFLLFNTNSSVKATDTKMY